MAYFLGNKQHGRLKPIELTNEKGEKIPDKLLDILRFTTSFATEHDLKDYLMDKFLIEDFSANLCYLISKGPKNNRRYEIIKQGDTVYLSDASKYLSSAYLKKYIDEHKFDINFLSHLLGFYLKRFGLLGLAIKRFSQKTYKHDELRNILDSLLKSSLSQNLEEYLLKIEDLIDDPKSTDIYGNIRLTESETAYFQSLMDNLYYVISQDDEDVRRFVNFFKSRGNFPAIPAIQALEEIISICRYINTVGTDNMEGYYEAENLRSNCEKFVSLLLYTYDPSKRDYKKVNGKYKINERNLCDLAMFIANYEDYIEQLTATVYYSPIPATTQSAKDFYNDADDEKEEFLEESDFARLGISSEEYGYNLRYGDIDKKW
ncbi:MAG: hypothetical protein K2G03_03680 [Bacilli bacterium]|nr:hypothetical protein [Bacilli bacterium]